MKNLHICFSNFKYCLPTIAPPQSPNSHHHHRLRRRRPSSSSLFVKNFNSLYDLSSSSDHLIMTSTTTTTSTATATTAASTDSTDPDFSAVIASKRFFISSPGESNSIVDSLPNSPIKSGSTNNNNNMDHMVAGGVAIQTYSPDPYEDFRRSMQEMFEAHKSSSSSTYDDDDDDEDWNYLRELLHCYLSLNPKRNHKFIVRAFSDLVVSLVLINPPPPRSSRDPTFSFN